MAASNKKPSKRVPTILRKTQSRSLKTAHRRANSHMSLKQWLRTQSGLVLQQGIDWLHNKRANTSKPELCLGKTRRKKSGGDKKKDAAPAGKK